MQSPHNTHPICTSHTHTHTHTLTHTHSHSHTLTHTLPHPSPLGMLEVVSDAATLRAIHTEHGLTGSFKDKPLSEWLMRHNPTDSAYKKVRGAGSLLSGRPHSPMKPLLSVSHLPQSVVVCVCVCVCMCAGGGELYSLVCWLLCGYLCTGDLRPPQ